VTEGGFSLELSEVALSRGERTLVSGLSFRVGPGQLALLLGPNGSGKTTLLRAIAGLSAPAAGSIRYRGQPVVGMQPDERRHLAYLGHLEALKKDLTVEENLRFISKLRGSSDSFYEILATLGLASALRRNVRNLSAGQRRRVALAALRVSGARLWLLDEPLTNLDADGRSIVYEWLEAHLSGGGLAVVATHLADELKRSGTVVVEF